MSTPPEITGNRQAARAVGRSSGALVLSIFGGAWILLATDAFAHLNKFAVGLIAVVVAAFVVMAVRMMKRGKEAGKNAIPREQMRQNGRAFGILNAVMWAAIFLAALILPRVGHQDLVVPAIALIVGLHFFTMPPLYRHRANVVTGICMTAWAIVCPLLFRGDRMTGFVALGAGLVLWLSAVWALTTADRLLNSISL